MDNFVKLAKEYDLEVEESLNFHSFFKKHISNNQHFDFFKKLFSDYSAHRVQQDTGFIMDQYEWDCSYLYRTVMFRKTSGIEQTNKLRDFREPYYFKLIEE